MTTAKQYDYLNRLTGIASYSTGFQPVKFRTPTTQRTGGFGPNSRCGLTTTMKRPTSCAALDFGRAGAAAPAVSAQAGPILTLPRPKDCGSPAGRTPAVRRASGSNAPLSGIGFTGMRSPKPLWVSLDQRAHPGRRPVLEYSVR